MNTRLRSSRVRIFSIGALIGTLFATHVAMAETVDRRLDADPNGEVEVSVVSGSVRVIGWDKAEVQLRGELGEDVKRLEFERNGNHTLVKVVLPNGSIREGSSHLTIHIPQNSGLRIGTVSANQFASGVRGQLRLQTVSGSIETEVFAADLTAKTVSGAIVARGLEKMPAPDTHTRASTVSGKIQLHNTSSEYELRTVSGAIDVISDNTARASMKTTNGALTFTGSIARDTRFEAETLNGRLTVTLHGELDAAFEIETFNGAINNCFGPKAERKSQYAPGKELLFEEGDGRGHVHLQTLNGTITLCRP
jgi:DUF4097 and DUF4098 domain-containing protein YvlB